MAKIHEVYGVLVEQHEELKALQTETENARCYLMRTIHQLVDGAIALHQISFPESGGIKIAEPNSVPDPPAPDEETPPVE